MKVNNETKVGSLALIAVSLLILGFNYLKGTSLFDESFNLYAEYENIDGLTAGNKVLINGMQVGQVNSLTFDHKTSHIRVDLSITENIPIPADSRAQVFSSDLLGSKAINLTLGKASTFLKDGDKVQSSLSPTLSERVTTEILPLKDKVSSAISSIDSFVNNLNDLLGDENRNNISASLASLKRTSNRLDSTMIRVDKMISSASSIVKNFEKNNEAINRIMASTVKFTDSLSSQSANIRGIITRANESVVKLKSIMTKIDQGEGSLGLLVNDKQLYNNLTASSSSLDSLLVDLKRHPKRYVHFSIFGGKDKPEKKR